MDIKKIWKNKFKIIAGVWNTWFPRAYVERIARKRSDICRSNVCGYYDITGAHDNCFDKGNPCCSGCGCNERYKTRSLSSYCFLKDIGKTPLWDAEMSEQEQRKFERKTGVM